MLLKIKASNGSTTEVEFESSSETTVAELKAAIETKLEIPASQQRLIFKGKILKDEGTLESYNIVSGESVHLVKGAAPAAAQAAALPQATPVASAPVPGLGGMGNMAQLQQQLMGMGGANPFGGAMGMGGMGGQNMQQMQQQMMQDPQMMSQIMNR